MRSFALAAIIGVGLAMGAADAREFRDPAGRIVFDAPANWPVTVERVSGSSFSYITVGVDDYECKFIAKDNPNTREATPYDVWRAASDDTQFTEQTWLALANSVPPVFPQNSAVFLSKSRDESGFWPMQRAQLDSPQRQVQVWGGLQIRPGYDLIGLCADFTGEPPVDIFDRILRSMAHPNDATFRASAEERIAARAAAAAAQPAPAPAPQ